ncbi:MAG: winged helix-turn-helix domain-containing protein [Burkholderiales bacterium]|nr:winged helix-turn-helix domain-containing protein [Burkholderiales bacterium]
MAEESSAADLREQHAAADPTGVAATEVPPHVSMLGDDAHAARRWATSLADEGLAVGFLGEENEPAAWHAGPLVLHVGGSLAAQLARLRALHTRHPQRPLMVVVRSLRDLDQVLALEMGADDVVDASLAAPVVAARLRALWRRAAAAAGGGAEREPPRELRFGALRLRRLEREVLLAEAPVPLTEGEFEVLWLLASHAGQALSRREILKRVRGLDDQPLDRSIDSRVYRIRAKLGDGQGGAARIRTVRHQGYAFSPTGW